MNNFDLCVINKKLHIGPKTLKSQFYLSKRYFKIHSLAYINNISYDLAYLFVR